MVFLGALLIFMFLALYFIEGFFLVSLLVTLAFAATCLFICVSAEVNYYRDLQADATPDQR